MTRFLTLGNGSLQIGLDQYGQVRDFYYHYPGLENHLGDENLVHKIGLWVDGEFRWLEDASWKVEVRSERGTMASDVLAENTHLGIRLRFNDVVYNERAVFLRHVELENLDDRNKGVKLFFNQQFNISQSRTGDTAYFDPKAKVIIHYKGRRVFLANINHDNNPMTQYGVGNFGIEGKSGTFKDAEDGDLSNNSIEHGQVDSVVSISVDLKSKKTESVDYWLIAGKSIRDVVLTNRYVIERGASEILNSTKNYWKAWVHNQNFSFYGLSDQIIDLFNKSLVQIRTHVSTNGAIIASGDSDMLQGGRDTYTYVWPRDAAFSAMALARAGDFNASRRFFEFCKEIISEEGYFLHKYRPDAALGSSWHPWVWQGEERLPIQEDETALVIIALWTHFELSKDLEFIESVYNPLIKSAAEFMTRYRDKKTGLPKPSYDLWEEKYGVSTFTASSVYGALQVASRFAKLLGKEKYASRYQRASRNIKSGILNNLYDEKNGFFYRMLSFSEGKMHVNNTVDMSSVYGIYKFGVLDKNDPKLNKAMKLTVDRLSVKTPIGGIARYDGDKFMRKNNEVPGNPWFITTAWYTQYLTEFLEKEADLPDLVKQFTWFVERALPSGVMSEQLDANNGEPLSATPLTWSHAEYVSAVIGYLEKLEDLGICKACYPINK